MTAPEGVRDCWKATALEGCGSVGRVVGAGTITRSHGLKRAEKSSALTMEKAASPEAVARSLPKYCADVKMRTSYGRAEIRSVLFNGITVLLTHAGRIFT